ncbi:MAG TPA: hypothetical protein VH165_20505 [Kofleriaceae bacterium]|nr:hypothetical protein [Kofleriaceae bacterium]
MRIRDIVRFELEGKLRPGVVIEVQRDHVRVAYGTTQGHAAPHETVHEGSRQGRAFPLREPTRFYGSNTCWEHVSDLDAAPKPCSWDLLNAIRKLVELHDASLLEQHVQDGGGVVHLAKLVSPIEGECQPVTRCGRALSMPWQLVDGFLTCVACASAPHTE